MPETVAVQFYGIFAPLAVLCHWIVLAITVRRLYLREVFGSISSRSPGRESNNRSSSSDLDVVGDPGSRSGPANTEEDKSVKSAFSLAYLG